MGVPGLRKWILKKFGLQSSLGKMAQMYHSGPHKHFKLGAFSTSVDYLYLDANGILHGAAQKVFGYGAFEGRGDEERLYSEEYAMERIFELFFQNILLVLSIVSPKKVLFIAIDGPAPRAKQNQQRQRRFDVTKTYTNQNITFTSNAITPGTEFMAKLTRYIQLSIRKLLNGGETYSVVFSSCNEPGEGEHKIMNYVRKLSLQEKDRNTSHCFYGPDADLIMLALSSHLPNMFLLGEDQFESGYYFYFDMGSVRAQLPAKLRLPHQQPSAARFTSIADDFVIMGFFVGNDFLPRIQMFHMLPDGLQLMIETYSSLVTNNPKFSLIVNRGLSLEGFRLFVNKLSSKEPSFLIEQVTTKDPKRQPPEDKYINKTILNNVSQGVHGSNLLLQKFKKDYYAKGGINGHDDREVRLLCAEYVRTLSWIHKYYTYGIPAWQWSYNNHYAPLMYDLTRFLDTIHPKEWEELQRFELGNPLVPFEQLLAVLPPSSKNLLPEEYQNLFEEGILVEKGYFPSSIKKDYEGKLKEHEAHLLVPFVDPKDVIEAYKTVHSTKTYTRNTTRSQVVFVYDKNYMASYTSDFGNIPELHVRKTEKGCDEVRDLVQHPKHFYITNLKKNVTNLFDGLSGTDFAFYFENDGFRRLLKSAPKRKFVPTSKTDELTELVSFDSETRVLDFGAGGGNVIQDLSKSQKLKKENVFAYDIKPVPDSNYYTTIETLKEIKDHSIDVVILFEVLHHIPTSQHTQIAKQILAKLKKGGHILIKEHAFIENAFWLKYLELIHEMWYVFQNESPDELYPIPNTYDHILELFGGKCEKVKLYEERNFQRIFRVCLRV